jgi:hypothetical protein
MIEPTTGADRAREQTDELSDADLNDVVGGLSRARSSNEPARVGPLPSPLTVAALAPGHRTHSVPTWR